MIKEKVFFMIADRPTLGAEPIVLINESICPGKLKNVLDYQFLKSLNNESLRIFPVDSNITKLELLLSRTVFKDNELFIYSFGDVENTDGEVEILSLIDIEDKLDKLNVLLSKADIDLFSTTYIYHKYIVKNGYISKEKEKCYFDKENLFKSVKENIQYIEEKILDEKTTILNCEGAINKLNIEKERLLNMLPEEQRLLYEISGDIEEET